MWLLPIVVSLSCGTVDLSNYNDRSLWKPADGYANGGNFAVGWRADHAVTNGSKLVVTLDAVACPAACSNQPYASDELKSVAAYGYGTYAVQMQAAKGSGVVSTFFTYVNTTPGGGEHSDEIDVEIPGARTTTLQATYYKQGVKRGTRVVQLPFDASTAMHTYAIVWLPDSIRWVVDGKTVYRVNGSPASMPTHASNLLLNSWTGGTHAPMVDWLGPFNYTAPLSVTYGAASFTPAQ